MCPPIKDRRWIYFECQKCGKCCIEIGLPYDPYRINEIARFLSLSIEEALDKYYGAIQEDGTRASEDHKRTPCPFITKDNSNNICSIYDVRPEGCRLYPLDTDGGRQGVECPAAKIVFEKIRLEDE
jgi:Fe-S-cluster containining protein